jgi:hypothetical protein
MGSGFLPEWRQVSRRPIGVSMDFSKIKNGQKIVLGAGILLIINLFLPWYRVDLGAFGSASVNAFDTFLAWFGSFLAIAAAVIIALKVFANMKANAGSLKAEHLAFGLAVLGFFFIFLRMVTETHFMFIGLWIGLIVSAILAFGTFLAMKEEGLGIADFKALGGNKGGTPPPPPPA